MRRVFHFVNIIINDMINIHHNLIREDLKVIGSDGLTVLLVIASFIGKDRSAFPKFQTVKTMCGLSKERTYKAIATLQNTGYLERSQENIAGEWGKVTYRIATDKLGIWINANEFELEEEDNRLPENRNTDMRHPETRQALSIGQEGSIGQDKENVQNDVLPAPFENFWEQFGYKKNRKKALSAFNRLTKANQKLCVEMIPAYLQFIAATGTPQMHPTTWINGERWNDDFTIPAGGKKVVNTDAALKDCDLPEQLQPLYGAYISGMIEKFPALWKSECRVLSQSEWALFQDAGHLTAAQRIAMTPENAAKARGDVHRMLNEKPFERQNFSTVYDAIVAAYIHVCNGQNATTI